MTRAQSEAGKARFLEAFARSGNVTVAAEAAKVDRRTVYKWRDKDEAFEEAYKQAELEATDVLEAAAWQRAVQGVTNRHGEREYSDTLLIFLLKARDPRKYAQRTELSGPDGGPLAVGPLVLVFGEDDGDSNPPA